MRAAATRTKTIVGRGDGTSQLRQLGIAGRKTQPERGRRLRLGRPSAVGRGEREKGAAEQRAERRWRGDQDQVDSRRENVCACSSAVGEYATSKFSNFSEKGKLTFLRRDRMYYLTERTMNVCRSRGTQLTAHRRRARVGSINTLSLPTGSVPALYQLFSAAMHTATEAGPALGSGGAAPPLPPGGA